jgi:hypothetical protein
MKKQAVIICSVLGLSHIACDDGTSRAISDLAPPVYHWSHSYLTCSHDLAMDGAGDVWAETGCESGDLRLTKARSVAKVPVQAAFAALPPNTSQVDRRTCSGNLHAFTATETDGSTKRFAVCGTTTANDGSDLSGPFKEAVRLLRGE